MLGPRLAFFKNPTVPWWCRYVLKFSLPGSSFLKLAVFRIRDILERIRICGSLLLTSRSGSGSCSCMPEPTSRGPMCFPKRVKQSSRISLTLCVFPSVLWIRIHFFKIAIYLSLGLRKGRPSYRRSLQPSKENIQHLKWNILTFFYFCFCGSFLRSWIQWPHRIRIQCVSGSTTLLPIVTTDNHRWNHTFSVGLLLQSSWHIPSPEVCLYL